jgi:FrmR/RcnR family transcriptional regulator, repressor of frmRAB operon
MPHTPEERRRVLARVRRIRGQVDAVERAVEAGTDCAAILQQVAAVRGAINGLMAGVLESHLRETFAAPAGESGERTAFADEIVALVRSYLR